MHTMLINQRFVFERKILLKPKQAKKPEDKEAI